MLAYNLKDNLNYFHKIITFEKVYIGNVSPTYRKNYILTGASKLLRFSNVLVALQLSFSIIKLLKNSVKLSYEVRESRKVIKNW